MVFLGELHVVKENLHTSIPVPFRCCLSQIEARVLLAKLLHKFTFDLVPGQGHELLEEMTIKPMGRCRNYIRLAQ